MSDLINFTSKTSLDSIQFSPSPGLPATCIHVDWSSYLGSTLPLCILLNSVLFAEANCFFWLKKSLWLHITLRMRAKTLPWSTWPHWPRPSCSPASSHCTLMPALHSPSPAWAFSPLPTRSRLSAATGPLHVLSPLLGVSPSSFVSGSF